MGLYRNEDMILFQFFVSFAFKNSFRPACAFLVFQRHQIENVMFLF